MLKLLSGIVFVIVFTSSIASGESPFTLIQEWSNVGIPFYGNLIHPIIPVTSHYHTIRVTGRLKGKDKFHINLVSGNDYKTEDITLHFRIDTKNKEFVTSKYLWTSGTERKWGPPVTSPCHLKSDDSFNVEIIVKHTHYYIIVNGYAIRHLHPLPPSVVSYVHLYCDAGDFVNIHSVSREYPVYEPWQV